MLRSQLKTMFILIVVILGLSGCRHASVKLDEVEGESYATSVTPQNTFVWPEGSRAALSLTFDDARFTQMDVGIPILDAHGVHGTFYVSLTRLSERPQDWKRAHSQGHEIGNHSLRHGCTGNFPWSQTKALEDYSLGQMEQELKAANSAIYDALGVRPVTFAYPCGQTFVGRGRHVKSFVPLVAKAFLAGRGWMDEGPNDPAFCDRAQLMGMKLDQLTAAEAIERIEAARENGAWLVFCSHEIGEGGGLTTRPDTLKAICAYASDPNNGIWMDTVETIARYVQEGQTPSAPSSL